MLKLPLVEEIRRLLVENHLSQRKIAAQLGVSRGTVQAIAQGRHRVDRPLPESELLLEEPAGPLERCPTCGGLVLKPCLLCQVRALQQRQRHEGRSPAWPERHSSWPGRTQVRPSDTARHPGQSRAVRQG